MMEDMISSSNFYEYHDIKRPKKLNISRNEGKTMKAITHYTGLIIMNLWYERRKSFKAGTLCSLRNTANYDRKHIVKR